MVYLPILRMWMDVDRGVGEELGNNNVCKYFADKIKTDDKNTSLLNKQL